MDLSNADKVSAVQITVKSLDKDISIPIDYIPCRLCGYEFICGHRALHAILTDDIDQYTSALEQFVVHSPTGPSMCVVCGSILEVERVQMKNIRRATREELQELGTKKGF